MPGLLDIPGITYTRTGAATAWDSFGNLIQFAANVPRITDAGITIEGQRTNLFARWDPTVEQIFTKGGDVSNTTEPATSPLSGKSWFKLGSGTGAAPAYAYLSCSSVPASTQVALSFLCETPDGTAPLYGGAGMDFDVGFYNGWSLTSPVFRAIRRAGNVWECHLTGVTPSWSPSVFAGPRRSLTSQNQRPLKFSGFQLEQASTPSTPIITTGADATRGADNLALAKTIAAGEDFTVMVDATIPALVIQQRFFEWSDGTDNNRILVDRIAPDVRGFVIIGGVQTALPSLANNGGARRIKVALRRSGASYVVCVGGAMTPSTSVPGTPGLSGLTLGNRRSLTNAAIDGVSAKLLIFPYALTDAELVSMTQ